MTAPLSLGCLPVWSERALDDASESVGTWTSTLVFKVCTVKALSDDDFLKAKLACFAPVK